MESGERLEFIELQSLRAELNSVIDRMNGNENFSAGTASAVFAFVLSNKISAISVFLCLLVAIVVLIGWRRYYELRVHARKLDAYMKKSERQLREDGGWTVHYYNSIKDSPTGGYSATRFAFWSSLSIVTSVGLIYVAAELDWGPLKSAFNKFVLLVGM